MTEQTMITLPKPESGAIKLRGKKKSIQKLTKTNFIIGY